MYREFMLHYSCLMHTWGTAQVAELWHWRHHFYSAPLLLSSCPVRYEAVLHSCGTRYRLVTVLTHGDFIVNTGDVIVLPCWDTRQPGPWPNFTVSNIVLTLNYPALVHLLTMLRTRQGSDKCQRYNSLVRHWVTANGWTGEMVRRLERNRA